MSTELINPIQKRINAGMSPIAAFLTDATCGEACWNALEEICRCSCGGENHGCMKDSNKIPGRTAKIDGYRYKLIEHGINAPWNFYEEKMKQIKSFDCQCGKEHKPGLRSFDGHYHSYWHETDIGSPLRMKTATKQQIKTWRELKQYETRNPWESVFLLWEKLDA